MKYLLIFWGVPVGSLALWYGLSINDIHFGLLMLTREFNDVVFQIYGQILGVDADTIRASLVNILLIDSMIILAIFYFKPLARLKRYYQSYKSARAEQQADNKILEEQGQSEPILNDDNLSKAP